jgi:hypothetical protein
VLVLLVGGCGGSSAGGGSWQVLSRSVLSRGTSLVRVDGTGTDPAKLQVRVLASPGVTTAVTYDVVCGGDNLHGTANGGTPFVAPIRVPPGQGSQLTHGRYCDVHVTATRPTPTATTVTIEMIPVRVATTTTT